MSSFAYGYHGGMPVQHLLVCAVQRGRDLGFLMNPGDGAVTALQFFTPAAAACPTHLLNGR